jgi:hypothetical protein
MDGFRHFFDVRPFLVESLRVRINAVQALDCVSKGEGNEGLLAFRESPSSEDRTVRS